MAYEWHDLVGNLGVFIIVVCYLMIQIDRMDSRGMRFSLLNGAGALLILVSLRYNFNLSSFIIECVWLTISVFAIGRRMLKGKAAQ